MKIIKKKDALFINWKDLMKYINNPAVHEIINRIQNLCNTFEYQAYIVGGFVRDFLMDRPSKDIDIVIEGNALEIGQALSKHCDVPFIAYHDFLTGRIELSEELSIDLITARSEYYQSPGALPIVKPAHLVEDLQRRDFSINSIAVQIDKKNCGMVIDYFKGLQDLYNKTIRILHNLSFYDDPTRIFRAIKFEKRYDFYIEENTSKLMLDVIDKDIMSRVSKERIKNEIFWILDEEKAYENIKKLIHLKLLQFLYSYIVFDEENIKGLEDINKSTWNLDMKIDDRLVKLLIVFSNCTREHLDHLKRDLCLNKYYSHSFTEMLKYKEDIFNTLKKPSISNYELFKLLQKINKEVLTALYYITHDDIVRHKIIYYIQNLCHTKLKINGNDLAKLCIKPGKIYKCIMDEVLKAKLDGQIQGHEEELRYALNLFDSMNNDE
ncbi:hypothetical protein QBE52_09620 [Clostridiaceae bacterium 35-E11]